MSILQRRAVRSLGAMCLLLFIVSGSRAAAQSQPSAASYGSDAREDAAFTQEFALGLKAEQEADFERAGAHYERALALAEQSPVASTRLRSLLALGWVHYKLSAPVRSVEYLKRAVADRSLPKDRARDAQALIDVQMQQLGRLQIDVRPPLGDTSKVLIEVDGREVFDPSEVPVSAGRHKVRAAASGFEEWVQTVDVAAGNSAGVSATLVREAPTNGMRRAAWIVGGVAAASLAAGIGAGLYAWLEGDAAECAATQCTSANMSKMEDARIAGDIATVTWIVAGVGAGVSAYLFWRSGDGETRVSAGPTSVRLVHRW